MKNTVKTIKANLLKKAVITARVGLTNNHGEGALDVVIPILISVVLGALLLAGLYTLFGKTVIPTLTTKIENMFNYNG